ncbi:MAG: RecX family transcriptional regulator [Clostridia bacterium]|nr:RecX family transcriptional regulator [Clostridia bacterium]
MGIVTGIEESRGRVTIYVDSVAFLKIKKKEFEALSVSPGEDLDEDAYLNKLCARQAKPAYEAALNLLTARDMTAHDLKSALRRRGYLEAVAEATCERLIENRLINDEKFAQRYVELRQDSSVGRYAMKRKLRAKGIDEQIAEQALEVLDDESQLAAAKALAARLAKKYEKEEPYARKGKLSQALARRGFSWDIVKEAVESLSIEEDEADNW